MSLLSISQLSKDEITALFERTQQIQEGHYDHEVARRKILIPLFLEPSTRTRLSFETAMLRLGGQVLPTPNKEGLAISKDESLEDTIRVISSFADILVIRHPDERAVYTADEYASVPVINGGNGCDEHPTQALLDLYSIQQEKGRLEGLNIALAGDLRYARTMHSLIKGLTLYKNTLFLISPKALRAPKALRRMLEERKVSYVESTCLEEVIWELDVVYLVMLQHHRIKDPAEVKQLRSCYYRLTPEVLKSGKKDVTILHPLVRNNEIAVEVDTLPNAAYFRQTRNGVFVRMALLEKILST
ncbi:aspartate carbamoyltransferase [candidate division KSB3 bacterium]|uniref:Aspartate carbamoyltransferase n=1 Tax=candidate division KSB3 bacterium TaxID=2044937 RepID=A0A2G6E4N2_9BACT|nr:MAG: aspartate carbamoyltransferase [candidate division KSB3 bacterium]PIE29643.1 MAG: aspartate carbamoyltransferase [candidate division KSB3 bacterium]